MDINKTTVRLAVNAILAQYDIIHAETLQEYILADYQANVPLGMIREALTAYRDDNF